MQSSRLVVQRLSCPVNPAVFSCWTFTHCACCLWLEESILSVCIWNRVQESTCHWGTWHDRLHPEVWYPSFCAFSMLIWAISKPLLSSSLLAWASRVFQKWNMQAFCHLAKARTPCLRIQKLFKKCVNRVLSVMGWTGKKIIFSSAFWQRLWSWGRLIYWSSQLEKTHVCK